MKMHRDTITGITGLVGSAFFSVFYPVYQTTG